MKESKKGWDVYADEEYERYKKKQNKLLGVSDNGKDLCISCGEESDYSYDTHIDYRVGYVEGAGQVCKACYASVYKVL